MTKYILILILSITINSYSNDDLEIKQSCFDTKKMLNYTQPVITDLQQNLIDSYDVNFYHLDLNVERTSIYIAGKVKMKATVLSNRLDTFCFQLHRNLTIDSIKINGKNTFFTRLGNFVYCLIKQNILYNTSFESIVYYNGLPPQVASSAGEVNGLNNSISSTFGNQATYTLSQPYSAYEWFPCKQSLKDKIDSSYCYITTDTSNKAGSNGNLDRVVNLGNGKARYEWKNIHPIDFYLISFAVAQYMEYNIYAHPEGTKDSILVQNYLFDTPQVLPKYKIYIDSTTKFIELLSKLFGIYPFAEQKYGHCQTPFGGGMEHQTMTSIGVFNFQIVMHELCHQWFGDNVTCGTWHDIWLNEGFAQYSEYLYYNFYFSSSAKYTIGGFMNSVMKANNGSVYVYDTNDVNRVFDSRLTYYKGASVIHTLRYNIGNDSVFFGFLKAYQAKFKNSTATTDQFTEYLNKYTNSDFTEFIKEWIYGEGYPIFNISYNQIGNTILINSEETSSAKNITPFFKTDFPLRIITNLVDTTIRIHQNTNKTTTKLENIGNIQTMLFNLENQILGKGLINNDTLLSVNEIIPSDIAISPNPANDFIRITVPNANTLEDIKIFDLLGNYIQDVMSKESIDISHLNSGIYMLEYKTSNSIYRERFIVSR